MLYFIAAIYMASEAPAPVTVVSDKAECVHLASNMTRLMRYGLETGSLELATTPAFLCIDENGADGKDR